ncbi:MAG: tRNA lysidine(34) synthetase TilS [Candidatus Peregrinibacteria bacterium]|nr:tRNA lysidine(34) synthetase TilS [Candidatus Peregrinibacteria bacterium]MDZ4244554.1 tRNA lysidine(34) synthetase TilS [Candidatus Gracilibacteria bacterium]
MNISKIKKGSKIIVALSGGPDSVYLLHQLKKLEKSLKITLIAAHLNHGTRFASNRDERFCKKLCEKLNVKFESKKLNLKGVKNFEETARSSRYGFFDELKKKYKATYIATGHHINDSIETVLLNLTRGCGLQGLTGIQDRDDIIRPIKNMRKEEILNYLKKNKIKFIVDSSNKKNTYTRNKIRNLILPVLKKINPGIENTFAKNIEHFGKLQSFLEGLAKDWLKTNDNKSINRFSILEFKKLDEILQNEILIYIYKGMTGSTNGLSTKQIENTREIILKNKNLKGKLANTKFKTEYGQCTFGEKNTETLNVKIKVTNVSKAPSKKVKNTIYIASISHPEKLLVRTWQPGDKFQPLGMKGTKKLQNFFTDRKIPKSKRKTIPIIIYKDEIVAVGDLAISEKYKIHQNNEILEITIN